MKYTASIVLDLGEKSEDYIKIMDKRIDFKRSKASVKRNGSKIAISVRAEDPVALVSSINSFLKQVRIIGNAEKLTE